MEQVGEDMVLELLSHRTPPESIPANILTVCRIVSQSYDIVDALPGINYARKCRSTLVVETKTLGA